MCTHLEVLLQQTHTYMHTICRMRKGQDVIIGKNEIHQ